MSKVKKSKKGLKRINKKGKYTLKISNRGGNSDAIIVDVENVEDGKTGKGFFHCHQEKDQPNDYTCKKATESASAEDGETSIPQQAAEAEKSWNEFINKNKQEANAEETDADKELNAPIVDPEAAKSATNPAAKPEVSADDGKGSTSKGEAEAQKVWEEHNMKKHSIAIAELEQNAKPADEEKSIPKEKAATNSESAADDGKGSTSKGEAEAQKVWEEHNMKKHSIAIAELEQNAKPADEEKSIPKEKAVTNSESDAADGQQSTLVDKKGRDLNPKYESEMKKVIDEIENVTENNKKPPRSIYKPLHLINFHTKNENYGWLTASLYAFLSFKQIMNTKPKNNKYNDLFKQLKSFRNPLIWKHENYDKLFDLLPKTDFETYKPANKKYKYDGDRVLKFYLENFGGGGVIHSSSYITELSELKNKINEIPNYTCLSFIKTSEEGGKGKDGIKPDAPNKSYHYLSYARIGSDDEWRGMDFKTGNDETFKLEDIYKKDCKQHYTFIYIPTPKSGTKEFSGGFRAINKKGGDKNKDLNILKGLKDPKIKFYNDRKNLEISGDGHMFNCEIMEDGKYSCRLAVAALGGNKKKKILKKKKSKK